MLLDHHKGVVDRYVEHRYHPGSGFQSLIEGNVKVHRLDLSVREHLADILLYIEKTVPSIARGSRQAVKDWCGHAEQI
jgi:hypothetical protein